MSVRTWSAGSLFTPGDIVVPSQITRDQAVALLNGTFADATGWDLDANLAIVADGAGYNGNGRVRVTALTSWALALNQAHLTLQPGAGISVAWMVKKNSANLAEDGRAVLKFYDALNAEVGVPLRSAGVLYPATLDYQIVSVQGNVPAGAAYGRLGVELKGDGVAVVESSAPAFQYTRGVVPPAVVYKATQAAPAKAGVNEPVWPGLGNNVVDGGVTWTGVAANLIVWQAEPILASGAIEPNWYVSPGTVVPDGTVNWEAYVPFINDPHCPASEVVTTMASKIFAADGDVIRYSATNNPPDWSLEDDAGFLPSGLQQLGGNDTLVLAPYRGNLVAFNASSFQNWQVSPDPSEMSLLDQMDGIGSIVQKAAVAVGEELLYLSALGVRSVTNAAGSDSLAAGYIGTPVDTLVQAALAGGGAVLATYYPSAGQYWLAMNDAANSTIFVLTMNGGKGKWSRYVVPFKITAFAQLGNSLYVRDDQNNVMQVQEGAVSDAVGTPFAGLVQWPWLDLGSPGLTKQVGSIDFVGDGVPSVSVGWDPADANAFTAPYQIDPNTTTGSPIAMPVAAPALAFKVSFAPGAPWTLEALMVAFEPLGGQP